jgi:hypothetical protein
VPADRVNGDCGLHLLRSRHVRELILRRDQACDSGRTWRSSAGEAVIRLWWVRSGCARVVEIVRWSWK